MTEADLLRRLTDDDPEIRLQAVLQAAEAGDGPAPAAWVEGLVRRLEDRHPGVQQAALESLARLIEAERARVGPEALQRALVLARHDSPLVRGEAVGALGVFCPEVESPQRAERVLEALDDPDPEVRRTAAAAAGDLGLRTAAEPLALGLDDPETRFEAAFALANLKDGRARLVLQDALAVKRTRLDALEGLRRLGDPNAEAAVRALATGWLTPWVDRLSAWATLYVIGARDAGERLLAAARSRRVEERVYALFLLGRYRVVAGRAEVARIAGDRRDRQRETALDALGGYGDEDAVALLAEVAEQITDDPGARITATRALAKAAPGAPALERLRRDPDPAIRLAARSAGS